MSILDQFKEIEAFDKKLGELTKAQRKFVERASKFGRDVEARKAKWREEVDAAVLAGEEPPAEPSWPRKAPGDLNTVLFESQRVKEQRTSWIAQHADEIEDAAMLAQSNLLKEALPLGEKLAKIQKEMVAVMREVKTCRQAARKGSVPADYISLDDLVRASFLKGPLPLETSQERVTTAEFKTKKREPAAAATHRLHYSEEPVESESLN